MVLAVVFFLFHSCLNNIFIVCKYNDNTNNNIKNMYILLFFFFFMAQALNYRVLLFGLYLVFVLEMENRNANQIPGLWAISYEIGCFLFLTLFSL